MRSTYETATGPVASMASPLSSKSPKTPAHMKMLMSKGTKKFEEPCLLDVRMWLTICDLVVYGLFGLVLEC